MTLRTLALLGLLTASATAQTHSPPQGVATGGPSAHSTSDHAADLRSIADFLAPGQTEAQLTTGAIDATPALNAALAAGSVSAPCGTYGLNTEPAAILINGRAIRGTNAECVKFQVNYASGPVFHLVNTSWVLIDGISIIATVPRRSGAAIRIVGTYGTMINNVVISGPHYDAIYMDSPNTTKVMQSDVRGSASHTCVTLTGMTLDTFISHTNLAQCATGLFVDSASGIYLDNMDIVAASQNGINISPLAGQDVNALWADTVLADSSGINGWAFAGTGPITEVFIKGGWGSGSQIGAGLIVTNPALDGLTLTAFHAHHNGYHGIAIESGKNVYIGGGTRAVMNGCGQPGVGCTAPSLSNGIEIGAGVSDVTIQGVFAGTGGYMADQAGFRNWQSFGLNIANGAGGRIIVADNNFTGNVTGGAIIGATGPDVLIHDNVGYHTKGTGTLTLAAGTTSVVVPHGLDVIPDIVSVAPYSDTYGVRFWVSARSATNFTVSTNTPPPAALQLVWRASKYGP